MGGNHGPSVTLPACRSFLDRYPKAELILVGTETALAAARAWPRTTCVVATEVVTMDDPVEVALRKKRDSSMRVAITQVKVVPAEGGAATEPSAIGPSSTGSAAPAAHACVSAGNTGALMALARYVLKTLDGIDRPAIATVMPTQADGYTTVLDLGANVDCSAEHLLQFALMGSALVTATAERLRAAHAAGHLNFHGNVEGNDIYKGTTDVVVCDGFVGNVLLKTSEGLAAMLSQFIKQEFTRNAYSKLAALVALPVLNHFKRRVDHRRYNGAALLGLRGLVFKSHGSADAYAFEHALRRAHDAARNQLLQRVEAGIAAAVAQAAAASVAASAAVNEAVTAAAPAAASAE
ncbi:MAG: phosphate acyltransferase [Betaproteobacteria bacterium]|nr:phosphate acyltransferase [Betaproteobacteria bacterium]